MRIKKNGNYLKYTLVFALIFLSFNFTIVGRAIDCLVPCNEIVSGGPPKDGIPSIDNPIFLSVQEFEADFSTSYLDELYVLGVVIDGVSRAYPRDIMNWHEIVNDKFGDKHICVTFCPLTGTGILYNTSSIGDSTLGTSGKLYENNLVFYDRYTDSYWSQMYGVAIQGEKIGEVLPRESIVETSWNAWKALHPDTQILSRTSYGNSRDYDRTPYPGYRERLEIWFRTSYDHTKPPYDLYFEKSLTLVLEINNRVRLYPFDELSKKPLINANLANQSIVILFDETSELVITYNSTNPNYSSNNTNLLFSEVSTDLPESLTLGFPVFQDQTGTIWNFRGEAIEGPDAGSKLQQLPSYNAFWFAATAMYPSAEIFTGNTSVTYLSTYNPFNTVSDPEAFVESSVPGFSVFEILPLIMVVFIGYQIYKRRLRS